MDAILDLQASLDKVRSWLRESAQICAWMGSQVADAEQQIRRIEQRLREGVPVAINLDPAPRTASNGKRDISAVQERRHKRNSEMLKPHSGQEATGRDVHEILGDLDDGTVVTIL